MIYGEYVATHMAAGRFHGSQSSVAVEPLGRRHLAYMTNVACAQAAVVQKGRNNWDRRRTVWSQLPGLEEKQSHHPDAAMPKVLWARASPGTTLGAQCWCHDGVLSTVLLPRY